MFDVYLFKNSSAYYNNHVLMIDNGDYGDISDFLDSFRSSGFEIIRYVDDLDFRVHYEQELKHDDSKLLVLASKDQYIPFDIRSSMHEYVLSMKSLFPRLNASVLLQNTDLDVDLLCCAYQRNYDDLRNPDDTDQFLRRTVYGYGNVIRFIDSFYKNLLEQAVCGIDYRKWFRIAEGKARIDVLSSLHSIDFDTSKLNALFSDYVLKEYGKLSVELSEDTPVLVSRAMEYMSEHSRRFIVVVMDGMSEFDWRILAKSFRDVPYMKSSVFAMIPTITSVSRQCLLSNKYPRQLRNPWSQVHEKAEFKDAALRLGFADFQIGYGRGYDFEFPNSVQCGAIIINDVDNLVHGQIQGREGMASDLTIMVKQGKLASMVKRFLSQQYDVFITADHGNTLRTGIGRLVGTGVETETKSHCMLVLHDYAEKEQIKYKYNLIDFPKYFLPKEYEYLICNNGDSLDILGTKVMTHGGISLDECIVPFVRIMAGDYHG